MPKEIIYANDNPYVLLPDGSEVDPSVVSGEGHTIHHRGVHVGWTKDQFVEVGAAVFDGGTGNLSTPFSGCFMTLDRAAINRIIRALRKARDQAYGQDA